MSDYGCKKTWFINDFVFGLNNLKYFLDFVISVLVWKFQS